MQKLNLLIIFTTSLALGACGGGGEGGGSNSIETGYGAGQTFTYFDQDGLTWSSPSTTTYVFLQAFSGSLAPNANSYCSQSTSINGGPVTPTNFNKQSGWSLPTEAQIRSLRSSTPNPVNWPLVEVWIQGYPKNRFTFDFEVWPRTFDFKTGGGTFGANANELARVVCVKPTAVNGKI